MLLANVIYQSERTLDVVAIAVARVPSAGMCAIARVVVVGIKLVVALHTVRQRRFFFRDGSLV